MARRRAGAHGGGGHSSSERWLLTYADLITLLLVFFVVMFALSQVDKAKYEKLKQSLSSSFQVVQNPTSGANVNAVLPADQGVLPQQNAIISVEQAEMQRLAKEIEKLAEQEGMEGEIHVEIDKQGLVISISNAGFFQPGEATLQPQVIPLLDQIARRVHQMGNKLRIEGHTDNIPISTAKYPSNWELSAVRATTIVRFLVEKHHFDPKRLSAAGYGEYYPKVANDTEEHRAQNRRVDIVVLREDQGWNPATAQP